MADRFLAAGGAGDTYTPTNLITGEKQIVTYEVTIESGAGVVAAGSLLGVITANGKSILSLSGAVDGSEVPAYILCHEVDATSGDIVTQAYAEGCFNPAEVTFGTAHTEASTKEGLRAKGIYFKAPF